MSLKILTIKKPQEFKKISNQGKAFYSRNLVLLTCQNTEIQNQLRVGYTVSKNVSKLATQRNLAKRRLREAFRMAHKENLLINQDYVLIARKNITGSNYQIIVNDLKYCLKKSVKSS